jgi:hypothetical protein
MLWCSLPAWERTARECAKWSAADAASSDFKSIRTKTRRRTAIGTLRRRVSRVRTLVIRTEEEWEIARVLPLGAIGFRDFQSEINVEDL